MTRIEILDFSMEKVEKIQEKLLDLHDYLKEQKFLAIVRKVTLLRKEIGILKEADMACERRQEELQEQMNSLEKELETYRK